MMERSKDIGPLKQILAEDRSTPSMYCCVVSSKLPHPVRIPLHPVKFVMYLPLLDAV